HHIGGAAHQLVLRAAQLLLTLLEDREAAMQPRLDGDEIVIGKGDDPCPRDAFGYHSHPDLLRCCCRRAAAIEIPLNKTVPRSTECRAGHSRGRANALARGVTSRPW